MEPKRCGRQRYLVSGGHLGEEMGSTAGDDVPHLGWLWLHRPGHVDLIALRQEGREGGRDRQTGERETDRREKQIGEKDRVKKRGVNGGMRKKMPDLTQTVIFITSTRLVKTHSHELIHLLLGLAQQHANSWRL